MPVELRALMSGPEPLPELERSEGRRLYGKDPAAYDAGRPDYPERVFEVLTSRCGIGPGARVLEIGPGTGRVTRRLLDAGAHVVGTEPDPALAAHLADTMGGPDLEVVDASFEDASLDDSAFDLVVAAMSFHWVRPETGVPKLRRVLRPGGWAALWWTVFGDPDRPDPFREAARRVLARDEDPSTQPGWKPRELDVAHWTADLSERAGLIDVDGELIRWTAVLDATRLRALYSTMAVILRRPEAEQQRTLDALVELAVDEFGGTVERPFVTALYTGRRS